MFTGIIEELGTVDRATLRAFASSAAGAGGHASGREHRGQRRLPHGGRFRRRFLLSRRQARKRCEPATWAIWAMAHPST